MRITTVTVVPNFLSDKEIILSIGSSLKKVEKEISGKIALFNVPEAAPPEIPRAIIQSADTLISIGLDQYQFSFSPPDHINSSIYEVLKFVTSRTKPLIEILFSENHHYQWIGIIMEIDFPIRKQGVFGIDVATTFFDKWIRLPRHEKSLGSFQLQYGFKEGGFNKLYTIVGYDKNKLIKTDDGFQKSDVPYEAGLRGIFDANNKVQYNSEFINTLGGNIEKIINDFSDVSKELEIGFNQFETDSNMKELVDAFS